VNKEPCPDPVMTLLFVVSALIMGLILSASWPDSSDASEVLTVYSAAQIKAIKVKASMNAHCDQLCLGSAMSGGVYRVKGDRCRCYEDRPYPRDDGRVFRLDWIPSQVHEECTPGVDCPEVPPTAPSPEQESTRTW
jgi:hypothetical protein